jgi:Na+/proline symporter
MDATLAGIGLFVIVQLALGAWASRWVRGEADWLVAGRRLGPLVAGFSLFATWFGAESVLGASSAIATDGLAGARADPVGYALALVAMGLLVAPRLWRSGAMTLAEAMRHRFGVGVERLAAVVMIPTSVLWGAAQIRAFGEVLAFRSPLEVDTAIVVASVGAVAYTALGGLLGDVLTDLFQGGIVLVGLLVTLAFVVAALGGPADAIAVIETDQLALVAPGESALARLDVWLVPVVGALVTQESVSRVIACRSAASARSAALLGGGVYLVFGTVPILLGLLGAHLAVDAPTEDALVPAMAASVLPPLALIVFLGAMVSAILSTVDSSLLGVAALAARSLTRMTDAAPERRRLARDRVILAAAGVACCAIALSADRIFDLVLMADSLGTSGVLVVTLAALWMRAGGPWAAAATLVAGVVSGQVADWIELDAPFLISLCASIVTFATVAAMEGAISRRWRRSSRPAR